MKLLGALLLGCCVVCSGVAAAEKQEEVEILPSASDPKVYGIYPIAYKEIIQRWLEGKLIDAPSAVLEWTEPPRAGTYRTKKGERFLGYIVDFRVNARNQFGTYTGKQKYRVVIRNGDIVWGGRPR